MKIKLYSLLDSSEMQIFSEFSLFSSQRGEVSSSSSPINIIQGNSGIYKWVIMANIGDVLRLSMSGQLQSNASLTVYAGHSELSEKVLESTENEIDISINITGFQCFVVFKKLLQDEQAYVSLSYEAIGRIH
jgi:hypothetical protein